MATQMSVVSLYSVLDVSEQKLCDNWRDRYHKQTNRLATRPHQTATISIIHNFHLGWVTPNVSSPRFLNRMS